MLFSLSSFPAPLPCVKLEGLRLVFTQRVKTTTEANRWRNAKGGKKGERKGKATGKGERERQRLRFETCPKGQRGPSLSPNPFFGAKTRGHKLSSFRIQKKLRLA